MQWIVLLNGPIRASDGRVVDQNVKPSKRVSHGLEKRANRGMFGYIGEACSDLAGPFAKCRDACLVDIANMHPCAACGEGNGNGKTDAPGADRFK